MSLALLMFITRFLTGEHMSLRTCCGEEQSSNPKAKGKLQTPLNISDIVNCDE